MRQQQKRGFLKYRYINQQCLSVSMLSSKMLDHHHYEKKKKHFFKQNFVHVSITVRYCPFRFVHMISH